MKKLILLFSPILFFSFFACTQQQQPEKSQPERVQQQRSEPWTKEQLMSPAFLADKISNNQADDILVLSIGFDDVIKGSTYVGAGRDNATIDKLKSILKDTPKDKEVVLYCGCCPFASCPNIRPTFQTLNDLGFKNAKLLDIKQNIKVNWLDMNYPSK